MISADSLDDMITYLTYLTQDPQVNYVFVIDNLTLPIDTDPDGSTNINAGISLALSL